MKKYTLFVLSLIFVGCEPPKSAPEPTVIDSNQTQIVLNDNNRNRFYIVRKFAFEGHKYLLIDNLQQAGFEHDPNCPCFSVDK